MILTNKRLEYGLPLAILLLVSATTLQDLLASVLLDRGFFLSESLLFKMVWLLFLPGVAGLWHSTNGKIKAGWRIWQHLSLVLAVTGLHLISAGLLISFIAQFAMELPFTFSGVEKYLIAHQGPVVLMLYSLVPGFQYYLRNNKLREAGSQHEVEKSYPETIAVRQGKKVIPIPVNEILYIKSETPYSCLVTRRGKFLSNKSLKQFQGELEPALMVRIHRSTIVNTAQIRELRSRSNGDYDVWLTNGALLRWSRNYPDHLKALLHLGQ